MAPRVGWGADLLSGDQMKVVLRVAIGAAVLALASPSFAGGFLAKPLPTGDQQVRFDQGIPTIEDDLPVAAVRVVPIPALDHGRLQFKVAVFNKSAKPINVGVENMVVVFNNERLPCHTADELAKMAKKRALWSQIGYAMLAGAAAAGQNNNTTITTYAPSGRVYRTVIDRPGLSDGQIATIAAGGGAIALSQIGLNKTLEGIQNEVLQTTTLDPQAGYGGRVVARKLAKAKAGDLVVLDVELNGEHHLFQFKLAKA